MGLYLLKYPAFFDKLTRLHQLGYSTSPWQQILCGQLGARRIHQGFTHKRYQEAKVDFLTSCKVTNTSTPALLKRLAHWRGKTWTGWGLHNFNTHNYFQLLSYYFASCDCIASWQRSVSKSPMVPMVEFYCTNPSRKKISPKLPGTNVFSHFFGGMVTPPCFYSKDHGVLLSALALRQAPRIKAQAHGTANPGDLGTSIQLWRCVHAHTVVYMDKTVIRKCMYIYIYTIYIIYAHRDCM